MSKIKAEFPKTQPIGDAASIGRGGAAHGPAQPARAPQQVHAVPFRLRRDWPGRPADDKNDEFASHVAGEAFRRSLQYVLPGPILSRHESNVEKHAHWKAGFAKSLELHDEGQRVRALRRQCLAIAGASDLPDLNTRSAAALALLQALESHASRDDLLFRLLPLLGFADVHCLIRDLKAVCDRKDSRAWLDDVEKTAPGRKPPEAGRAIPFGERHVDNLKRHEALLRKLVAAKSMPQQVKACRRAAAEGLDIHRRAALAGAVYEALVDVPADQRVPLRAKLFAELGMTGIEPLLDALQKCGDPVSLDWREWLQACARAD